MGGKGKLEGAVPAGLNGAERSEEGLTDCMGTTKPQENIILQELRGVERNPRAWRNFGLVMATALGVLAGLSVWKHAAFTPVSLALAGAAAAFVLAGLLCPRVLDRPHVAWMFLSLCLGWVMSRVILILLFCLVVVPTHMAGRLFGLSFMDMRKGAEKESLWLPRKPREPRHHETLF